MYFAASRHLLGDLYHDWDNELQQRYLERIGAGERHDGRGEMEFGLNKSKGAGSIT